MAKIRTWEQLCLCDYGAGENCERIIVKNWDPNSMTILGKSNQILLSFTSNPLSEVSEGTPLAEIYLSRIEAIKLADLLYETVGDKYDATEETKTTVTPKFAYEE